MVGMRVIEADDVFAAPAAFTLNADQLLRIDVVAVVGGIGARIAGTGDRGYGANAVFIHLAEQNATAFVGIGLLAVVPESFVVFASNIQHGTQFTTEAQRRGEKPWGFSVSPCLGVAISAFLPEPLTQILVARIAEDGHDHGAFAFAQLTCDLQASHYRRRG